MDFVSIVLFLILYYIRPQEWISLVEMLQPVKLTVGLALVSMIMRHRGLTWRHLFKTPHDWLMLAYFVWIVGSAPDMINTFKSVYPYFIFYIVTVQSLSNMGRIRTLLNWWTALILILAGLAVWSIYGFDPIGSYERTFGHFKGRLVVNTSIFNNPNSLGHSVVPAIVMLYFLWSWRRPIFMKIATLPLVMLPMYCIYLTQSKGAFLSGFAASMGGLIFGRPKMVQIILLFLGLTVGVAAIYTLPRMGQLNKAQSDQAIQGRVEAFRFGLQTLKNNWHGVGYEKFARSFRKAHTYAKASHSSYNQIGTELGLPGFTMFIGLLYVSLRTLWQAKTRDDEEERARRILFVMLVAHVVSSWMVDFAYRGAFFMMIGTIAAFHRLMLPQPKPAVEKSTEESERPQFLPTRAAFAQMQLATPTHAQPPVGIPVFARVGKPSLAGAGALPQPETIDVESMEIETRPPGLLWNRFTWFDVGFIAILTYGAMRFWSYIMRHV